MTSFLETSELKKMGFCFLGEDVSLSGKASVYQSEAMTLGDHVRIDDFCLLSGKITIGKYVHIAAYSALYGGEVGIVIEDFANISSGVFIYALSDDYSGRTMTNPTVPAQYKAVQQAPVQIGRHVIVGSGTRIMPGVQLREGTAIGAMSFVRQSTEPWSIYAGIPAKKIGERKRDLLDLERHFLAE